jgi:phage tail-like protein
MDQGHVLRFLPDIIGRTLSPGSPFNALAEAMVSLLDPVDQRLTHLDHYFNPFQAPTAMLPYLATWVDLGWLALREGSGSDGVPPERFRRLLAMAPFFAKRRGTAVGLETMLRVATGLPTIRVLDSLRDPRVTEPFHLLVELPAPAVSARPLVELIVRYEKPAHLTHEIALVDEP